MRRPREFVGHPWALQVARRARLLEALQQDGALRVSDLSDTLGAAAVTIAGTSPSSPPKDWSSGFTVAWPSSCPKTRR